MPGLSLLQRREIEAQIVGPLVRAFSAEFGEVRTLEIVRNVVTGLAKQSGAELSASQDDSGLDTFAKTLDRWKEGGALELEILEQTSDRLSFNVTRCRYAELYNVQGLADLGASLSCQRDYALAEGFNPSIHLERTQTIMQGAPFCDFRFRVDSPKEGNEEGPSVSSESPREST